MTITRREFLEAGLALPIARLARSFPVTQVKTINHITIVASNLSQSRDFYESVFGLQAYRASETAICLGPLGRTFIELRSSGSTAPIEGFAFGVDRLVPKRTAEDLKEAGVDAIPRGEDVEFADPDGTKLNLVPAGYGGSAPASKSKGRGVQPLLRARTFSHIQIAVADDKRSRAFYEKVLGLKFLDEQPPYATIAIDDYQFLSVSDAPGQRLGRVDHFALAVENFTTDRVLTTLNSKVPEGRPSSTRNAKTGQESVFIFDRDDVRIQVVNLEYRG